MRDAYVHANGAEVWIWLGVCTLGALAAFYFAFRTLRRARLIEDTPTARIRSAPQGQVELDGQAELLPGTPIRSPLTGSECCWWRYKIERRGHKNRWSRVEHGTSDGVFAVRDDTGVCLVDPEGAEVTPRDRSVWYGHDRHPQDRSPARFGIEPRGSGWSFSLGGLLNTPLSIGTGRYRYTEERIYPGDRLYLIGHFRSEDDLDHAAQRSTLTRDKLRAWKRDQTELLGRFDSDGDGAIDPGEWERARRAAATEAAAEHRAQAAQRIPHRLSRPGARRMPYLISTLPQYDLVRRYRLIAAGSLAGFFVLGAIAVWLLGARII
ncbi:MAG: GIDE domain-containing protein [Chromatiales bacterium]|jgi:hypothetical protein